MVVPCCRSELPLTLVKRLIALVALLACVGAAPPRPVVATPARPFDAIGTYRGGSDLEAIAPGSEGELWLFTFGEELKSVYAIAVDAVAAVDGWTLKPRSDAQLPAPVFSASVRIEGGARVLITTRASRRRAPRSNAGSIVH